jgi:putative transcriptional regulator
VGEKQNQPFQLSFNVPVKVDFHGPRVTSDGRPILVRDLNERSGLEKPICKAQARRLAGKSWLRPRAVFAFCLLLVLSKAPVRAAQDKSKKGDSEDKTLFLVARPALGDPMFKESVVLMFPSSAGAGGGLIVGLIVNRPARVALSEIFRDDEALKNLSGTAYFGGPVYPQAPGVVFRSSTAVKQAAPLFGDVYVSFDSEFIKELLKEPEKTPDLRLFVGRSQWVPAQLQNEMVAGAWDTVRAETNLIFRANPKYLWRRSFEQAEPLPSAPLS